MSEDRWLAIPVNDKKPDILYLEVNVEISINKEMVPRILNTASSLWIHSP